MSEQRVNFKSTHDGVCSKRLWQNAPSILVLLHKSTGNFVAVKLQLWHHSVSAAVVNPTAFLPHHTFIETTHLRHRSISLAPTGRDVLPASAGFVATSTRCTRSVSYVTVRGWCLWRWNVFNLSSTTLHIREIPFLVSHATFLLPFPNTYLLDSSRARPAQSESRTSRSITPSTRVAWTRTQLLLFVLRFLPK